MADAAAIILAGGRSSRMGSAKAALDWHGSTLLRRVTGVAQRVVDGPVVVVRASGQRLPAVAGGVEEVVDARPGHGPLEGLRAGLAAVADRAAVAYLSATDVPLLHPAFIERVLGAFEPDLDIVLPEIGGHHQPLAAGYRPRVLPTLEALIGADRLKPAFLFERCRVRRLDEPAMLSDPALARADPELASVRSLDTPGDYRRALAMPAPRVALSWSDARAPGEGGLSTVAAWTLGQLAGAAGVALDVGAIVVLNGEPISGEPELPLAPGDTVELAIVR